MPCSLCEKIQDSTPIDLSSKVLRSTGSVLPRPNIVISYRSNGVCIAIDAIRGSIGEPGGIHHRTPILRSFEVHKLRVRVLLGTPSCRQQIDKEGEDVKSEHERHDPLENGGNVLFAVEGGGYEDDCKDELDNDEHEFKPKGEAQDPMLAEVHAKALILGADENGADDISGDE